MGTGVFAVTYLSLPMACTIYALTYLRTYLLTYLPTHLQIYIDNDVVVLTSQVISNDPWRPTTLFKTSSGYTDFPVFDDFIINYSNFDVIFLDKKEVFDLGKSETSPLGDICSILDGQNGKKMKY